MFAMLASTYIFGLLIAIAHALPNLIHANDDLPNLIPSNYSMSRHTVAIFPTNSSHHHVVDSNLCSGVLIASYLVITLATCAKPPTREHGLLVAMPDSSGKTVFASVKVVRQMPKLSNLRYLEDEEKDDDDADDDDDDDENDEEDTDAGLEKLQLNMTSWNLAVLTLNRTFDFVQPLEFVAPQSPQNLSVGAWVPAAGNWPRFDFKVYTLSTLPQSQCQKMMFPCHDIAGQHTCALSDFDDKDDSTNSSELTGGPTLDSRGNLVGLITGGKDNCEPDKNMILIVNVDNVSDRPKEHMS